MSKKDYKQGISDAMAAYEAFGEKQEAAIRHVGAEIERTAGKVDQLGGKIGEITDYITDKEKAALYKLNTPVDIADLDDAEKRILLAVLYQLSADEDEVTAEQQNYVRAVQQYLKIYNPQTEIDLSAVENIEDISAQKAVLQSVLEFFRLGGPPGGADRGAGGLSGLFPGQPQDSPGDRWLYHRHRGGRRHQGPFRKVWLCSRTASVRVRQVSGQWQDTGEGSGHLYRPA